MAIVAGKARLFNVVLIGSFVTAAKPVSLKD